MPLEGLHLDPRVTLVGLAVGLLVGLTGVGGGSLVTPLLVLVMGIKPVVAVGTDLLYSVPTRLLGAAIHHRQGTVNWRLVRLLVAGGVPASLAGIITLDILQAHVGVTALNSAIKHSLGYILIVVSVAIVAKPLLGRRSAALGGDNDVLVWRRIDVVRVIGLGAAVGFLVSLTSIGSGSLTVPLLFILVPQLGLRRLVGSDVAFAAIITPVATLGHLGLNQVDWSLALSLLIGSLPGVFIGSKLISHVPNAWLRPALAGALLFAGTRLL